MTDAEVVASLREVVRIAGELAQAGGDHVALRNRAIEIAACAETMLWSVAPDESGWLDPLYGTTQKASRP